MDYLVAAILVALFLAVLGLGWVRLAPLPIGRFTERPGPRDYGTHELTGGVKYVIPLTNLPDGALDHLAWIALEAPRTHLKHQEEDLFAVVTRSRRIGFPDITVAWATDRALHIYAHLVYGKSDLGANKARVDGWLAQLDNLDDDSDDAL
ncbi:DUF1499 domain-containing protein [Aliiroseovarius sp. 2305UL8-7]|uniref:DUF1499 domain-containing protein n=1 Tax=Aliiroseovarius conchicola TaxID=3121637 RepID=UPI003529BEAF